MITDGCVLDMVIHPGLIMSSSTGQCQDPGLEFSFVDKVGNSSRPSLSFSFHSRLARCPELPTTPWSIPAGASSFTSVTWLSHDHAMILPCPNLVLEQSSSEQIGNVQQATGQQPTGRIGIGPISSSRSFGSNPPQTPSHRPTRHNSRNSTHRDEYSSIACRNTSHSTWKVALEKLPAARLSVYAKAGQDDIPGPSQSRPLPNHTLTPQSLAKRHDT